MTAKKNDTSIGPKQLTRNGRGDARASTRNAYVLLRSDREWMRVLAHDDFALRILKRQAPPYDGGAPGEWSDDDTNRTQVWLEQRYQIEFGPDKVLAAVSMVAHDNRFHPVRAYLEGLTWDGTPRVHQWLYMCLGVGAGQGPDSRMRRYAARVGTMWLVSAVARVMRPGVKADHVLILEGAQGLGKSSALRILGGDWVLDTPIVLHDKEAYQQIQGRWIVELAELDSLNKSEATVAKAFFSRGSDRYRQPYAKHAIDAPRQCVFAGSTNQVEYLRDPTGARRFWPVRTAWLEREELEEQRDQLWAEAAHLYATGVAWWPSADDHELFGGEQALRETVDPWQEILANLLAEPERAAQRRFTMAELLKLLDIKPDKQQERASASRVGTIMHRLGWEKRQATGRSARRSPDTRFCYVRPREGWVGQDPDGPDPEDAPL